MLTLITIIVLAITITFFILYNLEVCDLEGVWYFLGIIFTIVSIVLCWSLVAGITDVSTEHILDNKIAMYEEQNANIEQEIEQIVNNYLKYEQDTLTSLKSSEGSMALATVIPGLNSNTLVQKQISVHTENKKLITELKNQKINLGTTRWMLYFGK